MPEIIVGLDGSERAEDALAFARRFAGVTDASLMLASAYPFEEWPRTAANPEYRAYLHEDTTAMLDRMRVSLGSDGVATQAIADPSPAHALHTLAELDDASLIVVGSTHRGPIGRVLAGTIAERLLHGAPCPVAVVPHGYRTRANAPIRTIGVGYDGSEESQAALNAACEVARRLGAELRVVGVFDAATIGAPAPLAAPVHRAAVREAEGFARDVLDRAVAALPGDVRAEGVFFAGTPSRELAAQSESLDLLVLGARGYGPRRAVLLGGVSHVVVCEAACPVMVLPRGARPGVGELFASTTEASA
jgi:nucleotide-binding universal stress UspA family protein